MIKDKGSIELEQELNDLRKENIEDDYSVSSMEEVILKEKELLKNSQSDYKVWK